MGLTVRWLVAVALVFLSAPVWAQIHYFTLIDTDDNTATGCTVTLPNAGTVTGIERRLTATISETATPQVISLTLESCVGGSFGALVSLPGTPYPVGLNNGVGGADVIEQAVAANLVAPFGGTVRLYFAAQGPTSDDLLGSVNGPPALFDIQPGGSADIPSLSGWGLLIFALLLLFALSRHRSHFSASAVGVLLVGTLVGIAWAAGFRLDGQISDWQGVPAIGSDAQGDSAPNTDIVTAFAAQEGGNLFFRIDIANIENQAPVVNDATFTLAENSANGTNVGSPITFTDPDIGQTHTFTITAGNTGGAFAIDASTGQITVANSAALDFETTPSFGLTVQVTDNGTPPLSGTAAVTINLTNVNEAPVVNPAIFSLAENSVNGTAVGTATFTDSETGQTHTFAITAGNTGGAFAINTTSGQITVANSAALDFETTPSFGLTVQVTDNGSPAESGTATITVNLTDVNEPPVANPQSVTTTEDTPVTITLTGSDPENQTLSFIPTSPSQGVLSGTAPNLTYTPNANFSGSDSFTFTVSDGTNTSAPATITITITAVDDPPVAVNDAATVNEDSGATAINVLANDTDIDGGPISIVSVTQPGNGTVGITGGGTGLTYQPNPNYCNSLPGGNPNDAFTYTLTPGGSTTTVSVTVTCFNDTPVAQPKTASAQANMKIEGLSGLLVGVTDADTGVDGCASTFTVASLTSGTGGTVSNLDPAAGTFDFEPDPGFTGTATASYTVQDNGCPLPAATSAPATITVNVSGPVIWFVDPAAGTNGNGTLTNPPSPFNSLASANTAKGTNSNHRIFVYSGTTASGTGVSLAGDTTQAGAQWLIGQGATGASFDTLMGISPPIGTISRPVIGGLRPTIQGTLTLNGSNVKAQGFNLSTGVSTGMNDAAGAISGVSVSEVSVASTTGTAVDLSNLNGAISLTSVSANGAANGIVLITTTGSFTVTGTGTTAGTGGTIQNTTGADSTTNGIGVYLSNAQNVSLNWMQINDHSNFAIRGDNVTNFAMDRTVVSGANGTNAAATPREASVLFDGLFGTSSITNSTVSGGIEDNIRVENITATPLTSLTLSGTGGTSSTCQILNNNTSTGNIGFRLAGFNNANMAVTVTGCLFRGNRTDAINIDAANTATVTSTVTNNYVIGGSPNQGNLGINVTSGATGTHAYTVSNDFVGTNGVTPAPLLNTGINLFSGNGSTLGTPTVGFVQSNTVRNAGTGSGHGIQIFQDLSSTLRTNVNANTVSNVALDFGIRVEGAGDPAAVVPSGSIQAGVTNNNSSVLTTALDAIRVRSRRTIALCSEIRANTTNAGGSGFFGIFTNQSNTSTFSVEGLTLGAQTAATTQTYLAGQNPAAATLSSTAATNYTGVAANTCAIP